MARGIQEIKQGIIDSKNRFPQLANIKFPEEGGSIAGLFNLEADTFAQEVNIFEQLMDAFKSQTEAIVQSPVNTEYIRTKVLDFQYSSIVPQYAQLLPDFSIGYPTVDPLLRIISRCTVKTLSNGKVLVKVATENPPHMLTTDEVTMLNTYLDILLGSGAKKQVINAGPDRLYLQCEIFFDGRYSTSIQSAVITAINNYLASLTVDKIFISDILLIIKGVQGVTDVVIDTVKGRTESTLFPDASIIGREYSIAAGYIIQEDTVGQTFADTLTFTAE